MATILLQAAGAAFAQSLGATGIAIGRALGAVAGSIIDQALFSTPSAPAGRLATARIPGPEDGTAIPRLYGTARIGGTLIWATRFEESVVTVRQGGKGGRQQSSYHYAANLALALCEGPIAGVRRVFADGRELPLEGVEFRVHCGTQDQLPDPLIEARQGEGQAPAYRGTAYVVFEGLSLDAFGNRIPVLQFEVMRSVGALEDQIRAVTIIPGATEHGYDPMPVSESLGPGAGRYLNRNTASGKSDWTTAIDELTALCPKLDCVSLVVSWFGTDLRAGTCQVTPGVEVGFRSAESAPWSVSGIGRGQARLVSQSGGGPAYGGTPSDDSVVKAIADLRARGLKVFLYPLLLMDIPAGNALSDPYGAAAQATYPWRGRITCHPAPGKPGSPAGTGAIRAAIDAFHGRAVPADFTLAAGSVRYRGSELSFSRMILHYAHLARLAGGVDGFILGSELRGLTTLRDETGAFPFVDRLVALASSLRGLLGPGTRLTYGADWSEYSGVQAGDGSGDIRFHLDPLWSSPAIDAVGIDNYMPLADFRDSDLAEVQPDGFRHAEDPAALERHITAGEGFDWYYRSDADRTARLRSPITDGLAGKRWVYAPKDLEGWWANRHYDRTGGREASAPTGWQPKMKPIWFTELGCPAIDRAANQPSVFTDPKSAESAVPRFSRGQRADSAQRRFLEAHHRHWTGPQAPAGMVDPARLFLWCFDARPFPAFPQATGTWSDGDNWQVGHWLNGRLGAGTLADVLAAVMRDHGFTDFDVSGVAGDLIGYVKGELCSARSLIEPLLQVFQIDVVEEAGRLRFVSRAEASLPPQPQAILAEVEGHPLFTETRARDGDFADQALVGFSDPRRDHAAASARSRRMAGGTDRVLQVSLPATLDADLAAGLAETLLRDHRLSRRSLQFRLSPAALQLMPGDVVTLPDGPPGRFLVTRIEEAEERRVEAREHAPASAPAPVPNLPAPLPRRADNAAFLPDLLLLDLPRFEDGAVGSFARAGVLMTPWRPVTLSVARGEGAFESRARADRPAALARLVEPLAPSTIRGRFDPARTLTLDFGFGAPASAARSAVLAGANRLAVQGAEGRVEILGFARAEEIAPGRFRLSDLLNGLAGTEDAMALGAATGSRALLLDEAVKPLSLAEGELGVALTVLAEGTGLAGGRLGPLAFAGGLRAETPLAPAHLRARRQADGSILIRWIRRGRLDADRWEATDIPLDEPTETYRLTLLSASGTVLRSLAVTEARAVYAPADERTDFGVPQTALSLVLRQTGRRVPLGLPTAALVPVE